MEIADVPVVQLVLLIAGLALLWYFRVFGKRHNQALLQEAKLTRFDASIGLKLEQEALKSEADDDLPFDFDICDRPPLKPDHLRETDEVLLSQGWSHYSVTCAYMTQRKKFKGAVTTEVIAPNAFRALVACLPNFDAGSVLSELDDDALLRSVILGGHAWSRSGKNRSRTGSGYVPAGDVAPSNLHNYNFACLVYENLIIWVHKVDPPRRLCFLRWLRRSRGRGR